MACLNDHGNLLVKKVCIKDTIKLDFFLSFFPYLFQIGILSTTTTTATRHVSANALLSIFLAPSELYKCRCWLVGGHHFVIFCIQSLQSLTSIDRLIYVKMMKMMKMMLPKKMIMKKMMIKMTPFLVFLASLELQFQLKKYLADE